MPREQEEEEKETPETSSALAVLSAILGSVSVVTCFFTKWALASGAISIFIGLLSLHNMRQVENHAGKGKAILGVITGILTIIVYLMVFWDLLPSLDIFSIL